LNAQNRTSLYFFSQFFSSGTANAFAGIWLAQQSLSDQQIGAINSTPFAILLLFNIFIGRIADRAKDWRQVIIAGTVISAVISFGLFFAQGFWPILVVFAGAAIFQGLIIPVADAAALNLVKNDKSQLGWMRGLSTSGYLIGLLITGYLIGKYGSWLFIPLFVGFSVFRAVTALQLPAFRSNFAAIQHDHQFSHFFRPWLILPLLGWSIVYATHLVLNGFQALLWSEQGFSSGTISLLIAVGALSEAAAFFLAGRLPARISAQTLMLLSGIVTVLRWFAMSYTPGFAYLVPLQLLHGITYALGFYGCVGFIGRSVSVAVAAEAQSFFMTLQQVTAIAAITIFSVLASATSAQAYFGNSLMALVGTALIICSFQFRKPASAKAAG
jgi:MFS transporter, PPP family, 3-phenylpropionic acid transporter